MQVVEISDRDYVQSYYKVGSDYRCVIVRDVRRAKWFMNRREARTAARLLNGRMLELRGQLPDVTVRDGGEVIKTFKSPILIKRNGEWEVQDFGMGYDAFTISNIRHGNETGPVGYVGSDQ